MLIVASQLAKETWDDTLLMAFSSMLGMIPCGMFVVTSTALAQSVLKLTKVNALPQDIYSIEMLAMVDTLLLDKTGTITDGNLEVIDNHIIDKKYDIDKIKSVIFTMNDDKTRIYFTNAKPKGGYKLSSMPYYKSIRYRFDKAYEPFWKKWVGDYNIVFDSNEQHYYIDINGKI